MPHVVMAPAGKLPPRTSQFHRLSATSIGSTAATRIMGRRIIGRVHSVFSGAIDIIMPGGSMISVVREEVGRGPINIVTDFPAGRSMTELGVESNQAVLGVNEEILIGGDILLISMRDAKLYEPEKDFLPSLRSSSEIRANLAIVARMATRRGRHEGLGGLIELLISTGTKMKHPKGLNSFSRLALPKVRFLLRTIRSGRTSDLGMEVRDLVGLGPGLTPSTDDMLAGLMATLALIAHNLGGNGKRVQTINGRIVRNARKRTTTLSQEYLTHAGMGETNEHFLELIKKILTGRPEEVKDATQAVLKVGETSGTDTVLGILLGFQLSLDRRSAVGVRIAAW